MKIHHINDINKFMHVIDMCKGKVELVNPDIRLNLKSKLTQFVVLADILSANVEIDDLEIVAYNQEDVMLLIKYLDGTLG